MDDKSFKSFISDNWPVSTRVFSASSDDEWFRARPKLTPKEGVLPYLVLAGQYNRFKKIPDGLYIRFIDKGELCDVIIIECCANFDNFEQKRGKYAPSNIAMLAHVPSLWINSQIADGKTRLSKIGLKDGDWAENYKIPVRAMNVLYVLPDVLYDDVRTDCIPFHYEYFISDKDLGNPNRNDIRNFLGQLDLWSRFKA